MEGLDFSLSYKGKTATRGGMLAWEPYLRGEWFLRRSNRDAATAVPLNIPRYTAVAGMGIGPEGRKVWLDMNVRFVGSQVQYESNSFTPQNKPSFQVCNARLTVRPVDSLDVYIDAENLFDRQYSEFWGYPMPGRELSVGFVYRF